MALDTIYKATDVSKQYPIGDRKVEILHNLNLDIVSGEFVMLIGPSGCGKSTFMYLLFGLEPPTRGQVMFEDVDVFKLSDDERTELRSRKIAMIHQQPIWIKSLTVRENVAFPLLLHKTPHKPAFEAAGRLLEVLHLTHLADHHPHELSVGEQQRCSFMRALIVNPQVIFADEPTGSLDTDSSIVVMELFNKINRELGKTIVMVTHNLNHLPYASKVVSLLDGRITNVETRHEPVAPLNNDDIIDVVSNWHSIEHQAAADDSKEPELKPKTPPAAGKKIDTTAKRLNADIVAASERTIKK